MWCMSVCVCDCTKEQNSHGEQEVKQAGSIATISTRLVWTRRGNKSHDTHFQQKETNISDGPKENYVTFQTFSAHIPFVSITLEMKCSLSSGFSPRLSWQACCFFSSSCQSHQKKKVRRYLRATQTSRRTLFLLAPMLARIGLFVCLDPYRRFYTTTNENSTCSSQ